MKRALAAAAVMLAALCAPISTAQCQSFCPTRACYGSYGCGEGCICIQINGPGTQGFCSG